MAKLAMELPAGTVSRNMRLKRIVVTAAVVVVLITAFIVMNRPAPRGVQFAGPESTDVLHEPVVQLDYVLNPEVPYGRMLNSYLEQGIADYAGENIVLSARQASGFGGDAELRETAGKQAVVTDGEGDWAEWTFEVPESALYRIDIEYYPVAGKTSGIERQFLIDGGAPFQEASRIAFHRYWRDGRELLFDDEGNQIRPPQEEIFEWRVKAVEEPEQFYSEPYRFYLEKGTHTFRLVDLREPMAVGSIIIRKPQALPAYEEKAAEYKANGYKPAQVETIKLQAETPLEVSEPSLRALWNDDPNTEPKAVLLTRYNAFSGKWNRGGQTAVWEFEAPEDGLYEIAFRYATPAANQVPHRTIRIDGDIPFKEMQEYSFPSIRGWHLEPLKHADNRPFLFYFTKGKHEIALTGAIGPIRDLIYQIEVILEDLNNLSADVMKITASSRDQNGKISSDRNQDWNLEKYVPNLIGRLETGADKFRDSYGYIKRVNGGKMPSYGQTLQTAVSLLEGMARDPQQIPYKLNELASVQGALASMLQSMKEQPLYVDYIVIGKPGTQYPMTNSVLTEQLAATYRKFIASYTKPKSTDRTLAAADDKVLKVWVARGREWTDIIKMLVMEDFTPKTGIKVDINTIPMGSEHLLLLAYTGGKAPDVALGVSPSVPVDFSVRGALTDLNTFPDIEEVRSRFVKEALVPLEFEDGLYALPETLDFNLLFYREDVMNRIGAEPPQTWQDVYELLPLLQEEGMQFYYPAGSGGYTPFLFQHGGDFYNEDKTESALDTPEALAAFKEWVNLFINYKIPLQADFYQRFRTGEMPIGIGGYDFYVRLATAAPELGGRWKMVPLPGVKREDGTIDRSASGAGASQTAVIMGSSPYKEEAWEFLKWWMSEDIQIRYGLEVESLVGVGSRWNSANVDAMEGMAWSREQLAAIKEQWSWLREQPVILGGYYTQRHLQNAWNKAVLLGANERIALEDAVKEINKELTRKRDEYDTMMKGLSGPMNANAAKGGDSP
ncbi:extracellular solute-binding protein [Paenibacillus thermotolerans]|uniref:extracellular solute-binding protein n=1 Tax=Paenibacillus thermotolerans TaxID=3027807 RepID=UPI00236853FF|nr:MULTISPECIES: extracellular solute-binding protein [unclassified Paenibacillus]